MKTMRRNMEKRRHLLRFFVSLALFSASSVFAEDNFQKGTTEWGLSTGFGDNFYFNNVREDVQFFFLSPWWGKVIKKWDRGDSLEFITEGFLSYVRQESKDRYAVGLTPLLAYNFKEVGKIVPFLEGGAGILYTDLDPERFGSEFNFTPQVGGGIRYELGPGRFLKLSYRYHHISNAGLDADNRAIDSNFFLIGLSFIR
jgi:opacity protein-like surface antigen